MIYSSNPIKKYHLKKWNLRKTIISYLGQENGWERSTTAPTSSARHSSRTASSSPSLVSSLPSPASPSAISINSLPKPRPLPQLPQGRMKLFGTILYPKNRYWLCNSLEVEKTSYAMTILITWKSWWIGTKEENLEEFRLDFPEELSQAEHTI